MQLTLHFLPQGGPAQALLHRIPERGFALVSIHPRAVSDILENGFGKGIGFLEDHPDPSPHFGHFEFVDVFTIQADLAFETAAPDRLIHPVQGPKEGRLAATGRSNECGHSIGIHIYGDSVQSLKTTVIEVQVCGADFAGRTTLRFVIAGHRHIEISKRRVSAQRALFSKG